MGLGKLDRNFVNIQNCTPEQIYSWTNLVSFPDNGDKELDLLQNDNSIFELLVSDSGAIIGGYSAHIIIGYQIFFLRQIKINPKLKSEKYIQEIIDRIVTVGMNTYDENFKGITTLSYFEKDKKKKIESILMDFGGYIIFKGAKVQDKFARCVYMPTNGGYQRDEIKEVFKIIIQL